MEVERKNGVNMEKKDYEFVSEVPEELVCPICFDPLREPIDLPCFHTFCSSCIENVKNCPLCRKTFEKADIKSASITLKNLINKITIKCSYCQVNHQLGDNASHLSKYCTASPKPCTAASLGCDWKGMDASHFQTCPYVFMSPLITKLLNRIDTLEKRVEMLEGGNPIEKRPSPMFRHPFYKPGDVIEYQYDLRSKNFTLMCWIYPLSYTYSMIFAKDKCGENPDQFRLEMHYSGHLSFAGNQNSYSNNPRSRDPSGFGGKVCSLSGVKLNQWTHVALARDQKQVMLYLDGSLQSSELIPFDHRGFHKKNFRVGSRCPGTSDLFNGFMQFIEFYNEALDPSLLNKIIKEQKEKLNISK